MRKDRRERFLRKRRSLFLGKQERIAHETASLYAPLAHRLGMFRLKSQLEDLAFQYTHRAEHAELAAKVAAQSANREAVLANFKATVEQHLAGTNIPHRILARTKSLWSIYQKMQRQSKPFEEIDRKSTRLNSSH